MLPLTQLAYTRHFISNGGALDVRNGKSYRNFIHPFLILAVAARSAQPSLSMRLYNVVEIVVMSGAVSCCSVVCGTLLGVSVFSIMCSELLIMSEIS